MKKIEKNRLISIVTPCYNEEENIYDVYEAVKKIRNIHLDYVWEHIFIDNASNDKTLELLKKIAKEDINVKIIVNVRNFGHIKSSFHGYLSARGDAVVVYFCDLQDPPELISEFIKKWKEGNKIVIGVKYSSQENPLMFLLRKIFYAVIKNISETEHINNFTGFGLYDKTFLDIIRSLNDPYPYFRGLVAEYGQDRFEITYDQRKRKKGKSKNSIYTLYNEGIQGIVNQSKIPLRLAIFIGFGSAFISLLVALFYFIYKLIFWNSFQIGIAPLVIGLFFFSAVQLFFIGVIGEYIGVIFTQTKNQPHVIEKERINFESDDYSDNNIS